MSTNTLRNAQYKDLGETWYRHQAARIVQRHIQFGQHSRLDVDTLLAGVARRIRRANLDSAANECWRQLNRDSADRPLLSQAVTTFPKACPTTVQASPPTGCPELAKRLTESKRRI
jgi:hypothetical protein